MVIPSRVVWTVVVTGVFASCGDGDGPSAKPTATCGEVCDTVESLACSTFDRSQCDAYCAATLNFRPAACERQLLELYGCNRATGYFCDENGLARPNDSNACAGAAEAYGRCFVAHPRSDAGS